KIDCRRQNLLKEKLQLNENKHIVERWNAVYVLAPKDVVAVFCTHGLYDECIKYIRNSPYHHIKHKTEIIEVIIAFVEQLQKEKAVNIFEEAYHQIKEKNLITVALYNGCTKIVKEWEEKNPSISIEIDQLIKQPYILPVMSQSNMKDFIKWAYSTQRAFNNEVIRNVFIALPSLNFEEDYSLLKLIANTVIPDFTSELKSNSKQYTDSLQESILIKLCLVSLIEDKHIGLIVSLIYECMIQKRQEIFTDILRSEYIKNEESWRLIRRL